MRYVTACFLSALLGGLMTAWLTDSTLDDRAIAQDRGGRRGPGFPPARPSDDQPGESEKVFNRDGLTPEEIVNIAVYERTNRGVVNITTKSARVDGFFLLEIPEEGTGSGAVLDKAGHVLTNYHVVEGAREVAVTLFNQKTYEASLVGADPVNDIAVIRIDSPKDELHPIQLGDSRNLQVGMRVYAIGNPFGLERTMTTGIISSLNRSLQVHAGRTIKSIIQIDAAVNPGNSGGPLLDSHGRVIGINTAIASRTGQSAGVGFAIPVNLINRVAPQLIQHGRVIRPDIGIQRVYETEHGLLIARLTPNGSAERAGLRGPRVVRTRRGPFVVERIDRSAADLIVEADGKKVETVDDFLSYIESKKPGQQVELTIIREGRRLRVPVMLGGDDQGIHPNKRRV